MKKLLALCLCVVTLLSIFSIVASAWERPAGSTQSPSVELSTITADPDVDRIISIGLTTAPHMSQTLLSGKNFKETEIADPEKADLANHLKYGFSVIGVKALDRGACAAVDGVWATGGIGETNTEHFSSSQKQGAYSWVPTGLFYNSKGEAAPEGKGATDGYIYQTIWTCNFGKVANLDSIGFAFNNNTGWGHPQAADIYVSNDGVTWTLIGYYDRVAKLMSGSDYQYSSAAALGVDAVAKQFANDKVFANYALPANTSAQFIRVAFTSAVGKSTVPEADKNNYDAYTNPAGANSAVREFFVFGELTNEVKVAWMDPSDDPYLAYLASKNEDNNEDDGNGSSSEKPPVVNKPNESDTTDTEGSGEETTETVEEEKGGCSSSLTFSGALIITVAATTAATLGKKKRKK